MARLSFSPWREIASNSLKTIMLSLDGKYVGKQYMDNTMTDSRSIPAYFVSNLALSYEVPLRKRSFAAAQDDKVRISFFINNLFNNMYYADGWCWKNIVEEDGALIDGIGVYPQAPLNCMLKLSWQF
jgi:iron complex outermembrane receptor protein